MSDKLVLPSRRRVRVLLLATLVLFGCGEFRNTPAPSPSTDWPDDGRGGQGGTPKGSGSGGAGGNVDGATSPGRCSTGETRCAGTVVEVCGVTGDWMMKETCPSVCAGGACAGACAPADKHCGPEQTPETCDDKGAWIPQGQACPNVCSGKGECTGECKPGSKRCAGDKLLTPETCDENGKWQPGTPCANLCSSGSCAGSCAPGTKQCSGNGTPETCSAMGTWEPGQRCQFVCGGAGECTGECKPAAKKCGDPPNNLTPFVCNDSGKWEAGSPCPNVCSNGACAGNCQPGAPPVCRNGQIVTCSNSGMEMVDTCGGKGCMGTKCNECKPGAAATCQNNQLVTCPNGTPMMDGCGGKGCTGNRCNSCSPGTKVCSNGVVTTCQSNGTQDAGVTCSVPPGGVPICKGTGCDFACSTGMRCPNNTCAKCCNAGDCPNKNDNSTAACNGSGTCSYSCGGNFPKKCANGSCKSNNECCDGDCARTGCVTGQCRPDVSGTWYDSTPGGPFNNTIIATQMPSGMVVFTYQPPGAVENTFTGTFSGLHDIDGRFGRGKVSGSPATKIAWPAGDWHR